MRAVTPKCRNYCAGLTAHRCPVCPCHAHAGRAPHGSKRQEGAGWGQPGAHRNLGLPQTPLPCLNPPGLGKLNSGSPQTCPLPFLPIPSFPEQELNLCSPVSFPWVPSFLPATALLPKSHLVSFCAPVCFSSLLVFTHHFWSFTLCQYLLFLPIFSFLNHFIPFPAHPNQPCFESHILFFILAEN